MHVRLELFWRVLAHGAGLLAWGVFIIIAGMMIRSYFYEDSVICVTRQQRAYMATSSRGKVFYQKSENAFAYPHTDVQSIRVTDEQAGFVSWGDESPTFCGLAVRTEAFQFPALRGGMPSGEVNVIVPYWLLLAVSGACPAVFVVRKMRSGRRPPSFLAVYLFLCVTLVCAGCAFVDPAGHWSVFKASGPHADSRIAVAAASYTLCGKTHYDMRIIRFAEEDGRIWELDMPLSSPDTWDLWTWKPGEHRVRVPLVQTAKVSQRGAPPWDQKAQTATTQRSN